jgi:hypothetical protein
MSAASFRQDSTLPQISGKSRLPTPLTYTNVGKGFGSEPQREKPERNRMKENLSEDDLAFFGMM